MNGNEKIRLALVDDHLLFREGLKDLLLTHGNFEIVAEGGDGMSAVVIAARFKPDVLIIDLCLPKMGGVSAIRRIKKSHPEIKVIVVSMFEDEDHKREAVLAGADGYHSKMDGAEEVIKTIRKILHGKKAVRKDLGKGPEGSPLLNKFELPHLLTSTEQKVLEELSRGLNNKELADLLFMSERTVKNHLNSIFKKMGVKSRVEAVRKGIEKKWIAIPL